MRQKEEFSLFYFWLFKVELNNFRQNTTQLTTNYSFLTKFIFEIIYFKMDKVEIKAINKIREGNTNPRCES